MHEKLHLLNALVFGHLFVSVKVVAAAQVKLDLRHESGVARLTSQACKLEPEKFVFSLFFLVAEQSVCVD